MVAKNIEIDKFITEASSCNDDECLIWPFGFSGGRPSLFREEYRIRYKTTYAARVICEIAHGPPPTNKHQTAHSCNNGNIGCMNQKHMRWATDKENKSDSARGSDNTSSKLLEYEVFEIRRLYASKLWTYAELGNKFNVSSRVIGGIIRKEIWQWLEEPSDAELIFNTTKFKIKDLFS
jgi:hypothetical protein